MVGRSNPVKATPAATLILMRESPHGFEVFLQQRHPQSRFVGGAYVFPGGKLDREDKEIQSYRLTQVPNSTNNEKFMSVKNAKAYFIAAIRETFEESGILLAYRDGSHELIQFRNPQLEKTFAQYRHDLLSGSTKFTDICVAENLVLAVDRLYHFSHWITPPKLPIRFDTQFFATVMPPHQEGLHDGYEAVDSVWLTPQEAVAQYQAGEIDLIIPTIHTLNTLSNYTSAQAVIDNLTQR